MNRQIILKSRPGGIPSPENFEMVNVDEPVIKDGELKVKARYISVDPYLRGRMNEEGTYLSAFETGKPIESNLVAEVTESRNDAFKPGDAVLGRLLWKEIQAVDANNVTLLKKGTFPLSAYLGILGMTGLTAYFGLLNLGKPKEGEVVVVSAAAGAVGMVVGQLARLTGCIVVGITGSDKKAAFLTGKLHFDGAINYHTAKNLSASIAKACPRGIDIYFDNVGGEISDAVLTHINPFARILICGQIALYNNPEKIVGPRLQPVLLGKFATMQGFSVRNFTRQYENGIAALSQWLEEGKLINEQTLIKGFEKLPEAFIGLFRGINTGKLLVEIA